LYCAGSRAGSSPHAWGALLPQLRGGEVPEKDKLDRSSVPSRAGGLQVSGQMIIGEA